MSQQAVQSVKCPGCNKEINAKFAACPFCNTQLREKVEVTATSLDRRPSQGRASLGHMTQGPRSREQMSQNALFPTDLPKEARIAMITAEMTSSARPEAATGPISAIVSALRPSSATFGSMRQLEILLTFISFPFFVMSTPALMMVSVRRWGRAGVIDWVSGAIAGTSGVSMIFHSMGLEGGLLYGSIGLMLAAWALRGGLRMVASIKRLNDGA